jgi:hypothetical protein
MRRDVDIWGGRGRGIRLGVKRCDAEFGAGGVDGLMLAREE